MARIEFPLGIEGVENLPKTRRDLKNCFNNGQGRVIGRPGIGLISTPGGVARGGFEWNGSLYEIYSQELRKLTNKLTGTFSVIGTIAGSAVVETDIGFNDAVIVVRSGNIYTLDKLDVLTDISGNANFVPCVDVAHINGRFVYIPADGDPAFFSDVGAAGTVQALSFFDAEELPDKNNACFNGKNTLFIGGEDSFQLYRDTGASPVPFINITGSRILNGYIGGLLEFTETFLFVGNEKDQSPGIYGISQGGAVKISNERIDLILSTYSIDELKDTLSGRVKWRGYDFATFTLARDSFAFLGGNWFLLDTIFNDVSSPWGGGHITEFETEYFTAFSDKFGKFERINTDYGERITRIVVLGFEHPDGDWFSCSSIELGIAQGFNDKVGSVSIAMSRDGVLFPKEIFENTGDIGEYESKLRFEYMGGLGTYEGFMGVRFKTTEDIDFSLDSISAILR